MALESAATYQRRLGPAHHIRNRRDARSVAKPLPSPTSLRTRGGSDLAAGMEIEPACTEKLKPVPPRDVQGVRLGGSKLVIKGLPK